MAKIKFDHAVIYNGVLYPANTEIEKKEPKQAKEAETTEQKKETVKSNDKRTSRSAKSRIAE